MGNETINSFYRRKNEKSINAYKTMIKNDDEKSEENNREINRMNL